MSSTRGAIASPPALAALLEQSPDGVLIADGAGRIVGWNQALLTATGITPDAMASATEDAIDACLVPIDLDDAFGDGTIDSALSGNVVISADGRLFERVVQILDLSTTEAGRMCWFRPLDLASDGADPSRMQSRSQSERRRHALRMEAVGRLAGGIAHDFNNMLTVMIGFAEQLQGEVGEHESLNQVVRAARRAADLTTQLLAFSRQQVLRPRVVDVASVVEAMGGMLGRLIGDDVRLEIDAPKGLPSVSADPAQLEQIILNLVINARDAMDHGGRLDIRVRRTTVDVPRPSRRIQPSGEYIQLIVSDTGNGIAPDLLNKVFEPFFTTKGMLGTGLGLSTVYGIVKQSGGFIWVDSEVGTGTLFTIDLPVTVVGKTLSAPPEPLIPMAPDRIGGCILVVEDLEPVRTVITEMLEAEGYHVVAAGTPREALDLMEAMGDMIDLVLTDVMMPEMTGSELACAMRVTRPGLPVLFMSGLPAALDWSEPEAFLAKPFTRAMLLSHVRSRMAAARAV